jgi:4'-phosphopantetheinyl transferase
LFALPPECRTEAFFCCWTRKEAFIKALGEGLYYPLDQFAVTVTPDEPARLVAINADPAAVVRWSMHAYTPAPEYVAALAVEGSIGPIRYWQAP